MKLSLDEVLEDLTDEEIEAALTKRRELIAIMVGTLYPGILADEMRLLEHRRDFRDAPGGGLPDLMAYTKTRHIDL